MAKLDPSTVQVTGGLLLLAALFVVREIASGALKQAEGAVGLGTTAARPLTNLTRIGTRLAHPN